MNTNKPLLSNEQSMLMLTIVSILIQAGMYLLTGGFAAGNELSQIKSELKLIRQETIAANRLQDHRLESLEAKFK